ncbi:MAG: Sjogren's syndrome/scleroderma autoantigen 1 family protein [Thermoprotei archaeon]|nr:Sjogren's syndrome/scleroderma autoantigen 1 family protein [Thermoprotei archaeon]
MGEKREVYRDPEVVRRMSRLVAEGAVMMAEVCPVDGLPLFRLKSGEVVCPVHGRVWIVGSEAEAEEVEVDFVLRKVEYHAARRVYELLNDEDVEGLVRWLGVLEAAERVRSLRDSRLKKPPAEAPKAGKGEGG